MFGFNQEQEALPIGYQDGDKGSDQDGDRVGDQDGDINGSQDGHGDGYQVGYVDEFQGVQDDDYYGGYNNYEGGNDHQGGYGDGSFRNIEPLPELNDDVFNAELDEQHLNSKWNFFENY